LNSIHCLYCIYRATQKRIPVNYQDESGSLVSLPTTKHSGNLHSVNERFGLALVAADDLTFQRITPLLQSKGAKLAILGELQVAQDLPGDDDDDAGDDDVVNDVGDDDNDDDEENEAAPVVVYESHQQWFVRLKAGLQKFHEQFTPVARSKAPRSNKSSSSNNPTPAAAEKRTTTSRGGRRGGGASVGSPGAVQQLNFARRDSQPPSVAQQAGWDLIQHPEKLAVVERIVQSHATLVQVTSVRALRVMAKETGASFLVHMIDSLRQAQAISALLASARQHSTAEGQGDTEDDPVMVFTSPERASRGSTNTPAAAAAPLISQAAAHSGATTTSATAVTADIGVAAAAATPIRDPAPPIATPTATLTSPQQ
jgi:hypothetical protein